MQPEARSSRERYFKSFKGTGALVWNKVRGIIRVVDFVELCTFFENWILGGELDKD